MYSPKIAEDLVPVLYRLAKVRKIPMTEFVNGIIREALAGLHGPNAGAMTDPAGLFIRESEPLQAA